MKFNTFRTLIIIAAVALVGAAAAVLVLRGKSDATETPVAAADAAPSAPATTAPPATPATTATATTTAATTATTATLATTTAATTATPAVPGTAAFDAKVSASKLRPLFDANSLRDVDRDVLALVEKAPTSGKMKDAAKGKPYKVDLYSDDGKAWNRVKIDLNRNGKWDEKWSMKSDGSWHRQVASADDEHYDAKFVMRDGTWKQK